MNPVTSNPLGADLHPKLPACRNRGRRCTPWLKTTLVSGLVAWLGTAQAAAPAPPAPSAVDGDGWRSLFDGTTSSGWRGFRQREFPSKGWVIEDGILKKRPRERGGDLVSVETFEEFEFAWEWRIPPGANNGVKYFILEERGSAIGHEYQMIDDRRMDDGKHRTGAFYDVLPPRPGSPAPRIDAWNESRVLVQGEHVEHWLNGQKILEYELGSPEVAAAVARSKFKGVRGFGTRVRGHLLLTDHGDEAWFRNLRVRVLTSGRTARCGQRTVPTAP